MLVAIDSDYGVSDVDRSFKVEAGPGAGKTSWLINHINNVLQHSTRLGIMRRIACITYTNVAVETIVRRLGDNAGRVVVSTIHSFLYQHLLKPYFRFIAAEYGFPVSKLDGHDDPFVSRKTIKDWITAHPRQSQLRHPYTVNQLTRRQENLDGLKRWLEGLTPKLSGGILTWVADNSKAHYMENGARRQIGKTCLDLLQQDLLGYKKLLWQDGNLFHDDVLYFSYQLIERFPFLLDVIRAKFPYFFCDEFQDINPIQNTIFQKISASNSSFGIIGDRAQSIYGFQGASPNQFDGFLSSTADGYKIEDNWRSTHKIVALLNHIRKDIQQNPRRPDQGAAPMVLVGDKLDAFRKACELCGTDEVACLTRDNITANIMRKHLAASVHADLLRDLYNTDSNIDRIHAVVRCVEAIESASLGYYKEALKSLYRLPSVKAHSEPGKKALFILKLLVDNESALRNEPLLNLYNFIQDNGFEKLGRFSGPNPKGFYEATTFNQLSTAINSVNERTTQRTIHQSKGDEFDNVMVVLKEDSAGNFDEQRALDVLLKPNLNDEEQRVKYVAVSRARNNLFISIPSLSASVEAFLTGIGVEVERL